VGRRLLLLALLAGVLTAPAGHAATAPVYFDIPGINGVTLRACRLGDVSKPRPVVLEWTNYQLDDAHSQPAAGCPPQLKDLAAHHVARGYVYVAAQTRGVGSSTGVADTWSRQDGRDGAAVVEWIARQRWSTGKVGLAGCSSSAQEGLQVAVQAPRHLKAVAFACFAPDSYRDAFYPGGLRSYSVGPVASRPLVDLDPVSLQARLDRGDGAALLTESVQRLGGDAAFEAGILTQDTDSAFWREHSTEALLSRRTAPMLAYGSWADFFLRGTTEWAPTRRPDDRLVFLPGWHGSPTTLQGRYGMTARATAFFDQHLRGLPDGYRSDPPVAWWEQQQGIGLQSTGTPDPRRFRGGTSWPPPGVHYEVDPLGAPDATPVLLHPSLSPAATTDPRGLGQTGDPRGDGLGAVVTWTLPPLERTTHLAGPVAVRLRVTPLTPELDVYVRLVAVGPDGVQRDVTNGWLRGAQRALGDRRTTRSHGVVVRPYHRHDADVLLTPGAPVDLDVELWQTAVELAPGTRLRVVVTADDTPWTVPTAPATAATVSATGSHLVLPVQEPAG
jgi:predicted acyl esterase